MDEFVGIYMDVIKKKWSNGEYMDETLRTLLKLFEEKMSLGSLISTVMLQWMDQSHELDKYQCVSIVTKYLEIVCKNKSVVGEAEWVKMFIGTCTVKRGVERRKMYAKSLLEVIKRRRVSPDTITHFFSKSIGYTPSDQKRTRSFWLHRRLLTNSKNSKVRSLPIRNQKSSRDGRKCGRDAVGMIDGR